MKSFFRKLHWLTKRREKEAELHEELEFHLAEEADEREAAGLGKEEARRAARRELGNLTRVEEDTRAAWGWTILEQLGQDLRYAVRTMAASPLFAATAVLSLALGIGANTAIYSFMDAILLRSLPVSRPEQLVVAQWHGARPQPLIKGINGTMHRYGSDGMLSPNFPYGAYTMARSEEQVFSSVFGYTYARDFNVIAGGGAESLPGTFVSGNYFGGLGVPAAAGRLFDDADDRAGAPAVVALSHAFWLRRFGADPAVVGRTIRVNNLAFTVVGVAPPGFFGVDPSSNPAIFLPIHAMPSLAQDPASEERSRFLDEHFYWIEISGSCVKYRHEKF